MELPHIIMLLAAAGAAVTDARTGRIPNWLTYSALLLGPAYAVTQSSDALVSSLLAIVLVGMIPYLMFRTGSIGGGDVKLFAALGGLSGPLLGFEVLLYSMMAGAVVAMVVMARKGQLQVIFRNVGRILINPLLPKTRRKKIAASSMHRFRLGISIFLGTVIALSYNYSVV